MVFKVTKENNNFELAVLISTVLHVILFLGFIFNFLKNHTNIPVNKEKRINVMMVNPNMIMKKYDSQKQSNVKGYNKQYQKEIQQNMEEKITRFTISAETEERVKTKKAIDLTQKNTKKKIDKLYFDKRIDTEVNSKKLSDDLILSKKLLKIDSDEKKNIESDDRNVVSIKNNNIKKIVKNSKILEADIDNYAQQIKLAIEKNFYDALYYSGKTCLLHIKLAPDGALLTVQSEDGDPSLCSVAVIAARQATIPKPPSQEVYEVFKSTSLNFKP